MNTKKIKEIIELMTENDLTEIEIEQEGIKIRLIKRSYGVVEQQSFTVAAPIPVHGAVEQLIEEKESNLLEVKAPMVGTFYKSPAPDADPYVKVGDVVHKGDVLCIIEAMKLMNEVKSEFEGKIVGIQVENAEPIEFGQTIFRIEPV